MKALNLHSRQKNLLSVLNKKHGAVSGKELATALDVSERTIRSDIKEINSQLESYGIQIRPLYGKGYSLLIKDRHVFIELFSEHESYASKDDRIRTLMIRLLRENDWCELGVLEDEMFVSRTTLENDLKTVKKQISARHPYLQMERKGNFVRLENNEIKRRDILIRNYAEYWDYDSREGIVLRRDEFSADILRTIQNILKATLIKWSVSLDDSAFIYMTLSITVMRYRVKQGHTVHYSEETASKAKVSELVQEVLTTLSELWNLEFKRSEYIWLSDILRQLEVFCDTSHSKNKALENTDVLCHHIVNNLLKSIYDEYGVDYTRDDYLFIDLTLHVQALFDGIVAPQIQNHLFGDELRLKYPFLGDIVNYSRLFLEEQCEIALGSDENDYLFPFFISAHSALQRSHLKSGIKTSIVSHTSNSITLYLMNRLKHHYRDELDLKGPYPIHAKVKALDDDPYLILSTVKTSNFQKKKNIPLIVVSPLLERNDRRMIETYINKYLCEQLFGPLPKKLSEYFKSDLIFNIKNKESLVTTLSSICAVIKDKIRLSSLRPADPSVNYNTLLKNGFLFIYQTDSSIKDPAISLASLTKPISWKHLRSVQTIMYLILPEKDKKQLGWFYFFARCLSQNPELLDSFMDDTF